LNIFGSLRSRFTVTVAAVAALFAAASLAASYVYLRGAVLGSAGTALAATAKSVARGVEEAAVRETPAPKAGGQDGGHGGSAVDFDGIKSALAAFDGISIGKSGNIAFVDEKGYLVSCRGAEPFSNKLCESETLQRLILSRGGWTVSDGVYLHEADTLIAFCKISIPLRLKSEREWYAVAAIDEAEVLGQLNGTIFAMAGAALILVAIIAISVFLTVSAFLRPAVRLSSVMERIGRGDLDARVSPRPAGELGRLADSIDSMANELRLSTTSVDEVEKKAADLKKDEERISALEALMAGVVKGLTAIRERTGARDSERAARLSADLIELIDIQDAGPGLKLEAVDIKTLIKSIIFELEPRIRTKGLDLKLDLPHIRVDVKADKDRLARAFRLLIESALNSTTKGHIAVSARDAGNFVECGVSDTGAGIPEDEATRAFEWFGRAVGTGLELPIVKSIINIHKGSISVVSRLGQGTSFSFKIPK
jgi:signal transduction histidine kinase